MRLIFPLVPRKKWAALLHTLCVICLLAPLARAGEEFAPNPAEFLPESTVLLVQIRPWKDWAKAWGDTSLSKLAAEPELRTFLAGPLGRIRQLLGAPPEAPAAVPAASTMGIVFDTLAEFAPGPAVFALSYPQEFAQAKRPPAAALVLGTKDIAAKGQVVQGLLNLMPGQMVKHETYVNADLTVCKTGNFSLTFTFHRDFLILTSDIDLCKQIIDGMGAPLKKLGDRENFRACGLTGREHLSAYLDVAAFRSLWGAEGKPRAGRLKEALAALGLAEAQAAAWSLRMDGPAFESRTSICSSGRRQGILAALSAEPVNLETLKVCRPGCSFALGARLQGENLLPLLRGLLRATVGAEGAARLDAVQKKLAAKGEDLGRKLAEAYGEELVLTSYAGQEGAPAGALGAVVATLSIKDAQRADSLMLDLMKRIVAERVPAERTEDVLKELDYEGARIRYLEQPKNAPATSPLYALAGDRLIVALDMLTLKSAIRGTKAGGLSGTSEFQKALAGAGGEMGSLVAYVDWGRLYTAAFDVGATALKLVAPRDVMREIGMDLNLLPTAEAVSKHLFPSLTVVKATEKGVTLTSRGPLPSAEVLVPPAASFAAVLATFADFGAEEKK